MDGSGSYFYTTPRLKIINNGAEDGIRTHDLILTMDALYQAELPRLRSPSIVEILVKEHNRLCVQIQPTTNIFW